MTDNHTNIELAETVRMYVISGDSLRGAQLRTGVSESSATGGSGGNTPGAKDQLMYLSQLLGFTVQFSDFPKRNHGEYLSLVSLSTEPPVMCHGSGPSTRASHDQCARAALRALALMGLDAPPHTIASVGGTAPKAGVVSNGIAE
uniref:Staufen C-terminal domain-containing protein n=1 Tax=Heliothis virescens TaxID=7102 RepID=A0A2A4JHK6_HELVI